MNEHRNKLVEEFYKENYDLLVKSVKTRVGDNACEDVVQEAFTRCIRSFDSYNPSRGAFDTWFRVILTNVVNAYLNSERNGGSYSDDELEAVEEEDRHYERAILDEVRKFISDKFDTHSEVLRLYYLSGYTPRQIASVTTVKVKEIDNILQSFKKELGEKYA